MISKLLIANRGEIACRIARTAQRLGVQTVAVYSEADRLAPHVRLCDEAILIGPAAAAESYLRIDKIVDAAKRTGADAIHPGYGFLSENAAFADAVETAGLVFVGPTADVIDKMGSKAASKDLMAAAGVPITPGYQGADQSLETFEREAAAIGFPVLVKASAGGGGKGMRIVEAPSDLSEAIGSAQREAKSAFGDDRLLIEKYVPRARHLEVQIVGDGKGGVVHIFERDCSVQRRHQKIIEEAPAPRLPADVRARLLEAGVAAGRAVNYRGAGTVEFLYDGADGLYFIEMNTRLQVEHPVSEAITGLDLVEWQLRIASGEELPLSQDQITETGHAFEARLYAENPYQQFKPSIGVLSTLDLPDHRARVDSGVAQGSRVTPHYDPMISKIIVHGPTRSEALGALRGALSETRVAGVECNTEFLYAIAAEPDFIDGDVSTRFIDEHGDALFARFDTNAVLWGAAFMWRRRRSGASSGPSQFEGFRLNASPTTYLWVLHDGAPALLCVAREGGVYQASLQPSAAVAHRKRGEEPAAPILFSFNGEMDSTGSFWLETGGERFQGTAAAHGDALRIWLGARSADVAFADPLEASSDKGAEGGSLAASMPGVVTQLCAEPGADVEAGAPLLIMEAMKMEHTIKAPAEGRLAGYKFAVGDQVKEGALLVDFEPKS
ncbi:MAG: biotin carboxylase N-terminal domain-containing protein [Pseudomonadota bacterium]